MATAVFDTLKASDNLKAAGIEAKQAEAIVHTMAGAFEDTVATKADLDKLESSVKTDMANLKAELKAEIAEVRTELKQDIAEVKVELKGTATKRIWSKSRPTYSRSPLESSSRSSWRTPP